MKTNRQHFSGRAPVSLEESTQQKKTPALVKSLPAVRPFSQTPVQKKKTEKKEEPDAHISEQVNSITENITGENPGSPALSSVGSAAVSHPVQRVAFWDKIKAGASSVGSSISSGASSLWNATKSGASAAGSAIASGASKAWDVTKSGASTAWDKTKSGASAAGSAIGSGASWLWDKTKSGASAAWGATKSAASTVGSAASYGWDKTKEFAGDAAAAAYTAPGKAKAFINKDENIDRKNTALGSMLPTALTGAGIYSAVDAGQKGFIQQGQSAGSIVGGSLGIAGGLATGAMGGYDLFKGASEKWKEKDKDGKEIEVRDTRRALLGAADLTSGGLSIASGGLSIAGTTGMAIPGLGIASAGLDTVVQGGKSIYAHKQMNKLAEMQDRIKDRNKSTPDFALSKGEGYTGDLKKQYALFNIAKEAMDVRRKQRNRAGINAVGSAVETAGHSTVVGAGVTGIGAAVGMGLVAGGKGIKGIAALVRGAKQKMIDKGWIGKGKDDERTTENKEKRAQAFIENVLENHDDLEVIEAMDALGANKEQIALLREGKLPRADIYKLYKAR